MKPDPYLALLGLSMSLLAVVASADEKPENVNALLDPIRAKHNAPALSAAAMIKGKIAAAGAVGMRKSGGSERVTENDLWHIGSCTKSMTASLAALLVQEGKLRWETTVGEVFANLRGRIHDSWARVTLEQLLVHRGGAPAEPPKDLWSAAWQQRGTPQAERLEFVTGLITRPTEAPAGEKYIYSNQGYAIAGAMLEKVAGQPFEKLLVERLFVPLGLKSAGFGAPGDARKMDHPWGHRSAGAKAEPVPPAPQADNPRAITPAGRVHLSISDFARYGGWHARSTANGPALLNAASFLKLHTAAAGEGAKYAMGWGVHQRGWAGGDALSHGGSNTMWFAVIWIAPAKDAAFVAATNIAGDGAEKACDDAVAALINKLLVSK